MPSREKFEKLCSILLDNNIPDVSDAEYMNRLLRDIRNYLGKIECTLNEIKKFTEVLQVLDATNKKNIQNNPEEF